MFSKLPGASTARSLKLNSPWDARDDDFVDAPPDYGTVGFPDGSTGGFSRAAEPSLAISNGSPTVREEPAFPFPAGDFDSIPSGPTHSIGAGNLDELMDHLNRGGETWDPTDPDGGVTLRIAFPQDYDDIPLYWRTHDHLDTPEDAADLGLDFFNAEQQAFAMQAAQAWTDMAKVHFVQVGPDEEADIYFYGKHLAHGSAQSTGIDATHGSRIAIDMDNGWPDMQPGVNGFRTVMHEIGHSLGLTHPGEYDAPNYKGYYWDAEYIEDTKMYTIMSYNSGIYSGFDAGGRNPGTVTPRSHDAYVIQELYGANWETRDGDSIYGYNASGVGALYDFTNYAGPGEFDPPLMTIWDGGGEDWLDLSSAILPVTLDLQPGAFSSTHGMTKNISLAYVPAGAPDDLAGYIENARGGAGDDTITGNIRDNQLVGNAGNDVLGGLDGNDTLEGGSGNDTLKGGGGADTLDGGTGDDDMAGEAGNDIYFVDSNGDIVVENPNQGTDVVHATIDTTIGANIETLFLDGAANIAGTGNSANNAVFGNSGHNTLDGRGGADVLTGHAGRDTFQFRAFESVGDVVIDFAGNGAAAGDSFAFLGFGTAKQGATFTQIGATHQWQIHSGLDGHNEIITLQNGAAVHASDFLFV